jgi:branched-chain amino acid transport system permease protein
MLGAIYVIFVLFVPYGIVGTWKLRGFRWRQGWERLLSLVTGDGEGMPEET